MHPADKVITRILAVYGQQVHSTKLVKLVYLVDYLHYQHFGRTLTTFEYMWDHFGPNAVGHGIVERASELARTGILQLAQHPNIYGGTSALFKIAPRTPPLELAPEAEMIVYDVLQQYGRLSVTEIAAATKRTAPFKKAGQYSVLKMEPTTPAETTSSEDWEAYQRDLKEQGTRSLDEVYGSASPKWLCTLLLRPSVS